MHPPHTWPVHQEEQFKERARSPARSGRKWRQCLPQMLLEQLQSEGKPPPDIDVTLQMFTHFFSQSKPQDLFVYKAGRDVPSVRYFQHSNDPSYNRAERMKARIISLNNKIDTESAQLCSLVIFSTVFKKWS